MALFDYHRFSLLLQNQLPISILKIKWT